MLVKCFNCNPDLELEPWVVQTSTWGLDSLCHLPQGARAIKRTNQEIADITTETVGLD